MNILKRIYWRIRLYFITRSIIRKRKKRTCIPLAPDARYYIKENFIAVDITDDDGLTLQLAL